MKFTMSRQDGMNGHSLPCERGSDDGHRENPAVREAQSPAVNGRCNRCRTSKTSCSHL
jgi:hypothetical protein